MATTTPKIAFLGLGAMGFGMATNLLKTGHNVTGFDVWQPTLDRFVAAGGAGTKSPKDCVSGAPFVVFMVATAAQIQSALFEGENAAFQELGKEAVVVLCSTGPPEHSLLVRKGLDERGRKDVRVVDAPVSGGTIRAANGTLTILASGPDEDLVAADAVLKAMAGPNLHIISGGLGAGTNVKMVHQVLAGIYITMTSEAMAFAAALGVNSKKAFEVLKAGKGSSWMFENRTPHMLVDDKTVYSALNIIVKDIGIVTAGGRAADFPLFLASTTEQVLASAIGAGLGLIDDAGLVAIYNPQAPSLILSLASAETTAEDEEKLKLVTQVMAGVHLAAAAEAMSLGAIVGLETKQLFEIISGAAGSSAMFVESTKQWLSGDWSSTSTVDDVAEELTEAIEAANRLTFPLHLGATALQIFQFAKLKGWGKEPSAAIVKTWEGAAGPLFPRK